jgi:shikimate 5-dehydrogenase
MSHPDRFLLAGVMGWPIMHSRSPKLHGYWLDHYGLTGAYVPLAIKAEGLEVALRALPALGFAGCNLTIPHKEAALRIVDAASPLARRIGAVNCIVVRADGSLEGRNYDAFGFTESLRERAPDLRFDAGPAVVIGAGGASRAILAGLMDEGVPEIRLINRSPVRAQALQEVQAQEPPPAPEQGPAAPTGGCVFLPAPSVGGCRRRAHPWASPSCCKAPRPQTRSSQTLSGFCSPTTPTWVCKIPPLGT